MYILSVTVLKLFMKIQNNLMRFASKISEILKIPIKRPSFSRKKIMYNDLCHSMVTLHKKRSFPLRISLVNVTKSAGNLAVYGAFLDP